MLQAIEHYTKEAANSQAFDVDKALLGMLRRGWTTFATASKRALPVSVSGRHSKRSISEARRVTSHPANSAAPRSQDVRMFLPH